MSVSSSAWEYQTLRAWLRLVLTPGVGNATARRLLTRMGNVEAIFEASSQTLQSCVSAAQATQLQQVPQTLETLLQTTWRWLHTPASTELAHALIVLGDCRYPTSLLHIEDPPLMLYAVGPVAYLEHGIPLLDMANSLAIIGTRNPTAQGVDNARQFAKSLAGMGWSIVSGMAIGVDAAAHEGALDRYMSPTIQATAPVTVAVVGTGVDRVYPAKHKTLCHRIAQHGLLLSEFPLGTPPIANNFPKRNRIISGLTCGTLVVEAALASGSLITARLACEQGREVFAIPGSIHAPQSRGCHALIRQGAKLVETAQDIVEELQVTLSPVAVPVLRVPDDASANTGIFSSQLPAHPLLQALGYDPVGLDLLSARTGWDAATLQAQLLELELDGWVTVLPGGLFQRTAST